MPEITNVCVAGGNFGISEKLYLGFCNDSQVMYDAGEDAGLQEMTGGYEYNTEEQNVVGNPRVQTQNTSFKETYELTMKETGTISPFRARLMELKRVLSENDWLGSTNGGLIAKKVKRFKGGQTVTTWKNLVFQDKGLEDMMAENKNEWTLTLIANQKAEEFHTTLINSIPKMYADELSTSKFVTAPTIAMTGTNATFTFTGNFTVNDTQRFLWANRYELVKISETGEQTVLLSTLSPSSPKLTFTSPSTLTGFTSQTIAKGDTIVLFGYRDASVKVQLWAYENL